jgi:hypothetical protein
MDHAAVDIDIACHSLIPGAATASRCWIPDRSAQPGGHIKDKVMLQQRVEAVITAHRRSSPLRQEVPLRQAGASRAGPWGEVVGGAAPIALSMKMVAATHFSASAQASGIVCESGRHPQTAELLGPS